MLSKLSPPALGRVHPRERLFARLDAACARGVVWLTGAPGAGKTALLASWVARRRLRAAWLRLDEADGDPANFFHFLSRSVRARLTRAALPAFRPERAAALDAFAREYFRALAVIGGRWLLVLDDYHDLPEDSPVHRALTVGLAELAGAATVLIASRTPPPAPMSRLRASGGLAQLPAAELLLTRGEAEAILRLRGVHRPRATAARLHPAVGGWVAGLVLASEADGEGSGALERSVFDYLDAELLARTTPLARDVLLASALVPAASAELACVLSGADKAGPVLEAFARRGFFTERHGRTAPTYRFHDLFRAYLLDRVRRDWTAERLHAARLRGAAWLERADRPEEALRLLAEAGAWDPAARVARAAAPAMLREGRARQLLLWADRAPARERVAHPWLGFWCAMARFPFDPESARSELHQVFEAFVEAGDAEGAWAAWAQRTVMLGWGGARVEALDDWIDVLERLPARVGPFPAGEIGAQVVAAAVCAFVQRRPGDPRLAHWEQRAIEIALGAAPLRERLEVGRQLVLWKGWWAADLRVARLLLDSLGVTATRAGADPTGALFWLIAEADLHAHLADAERCLRAVERGLAIARETGIRLWTPVLLAVAAWGELAADDLSAARRWVEQLGREVHDGEAQNRCAYHQAAAQVALRCGVLSEAREHARAARSLADAIGIPLAQCSCLLTCALVAEREGEGEHGILEALGLARAASNRYAELGALFALARTALAKSDPDQAARWTTEAFAVAQRTGCVHLAWFGAEDLAEVCAFALERGIAPEQVRQFIRVRRISPAPRASPASWPWSVRVEVSGDAISIQREGEARPPSRKQPKVPLLLLRLLIDAGPRGVSASDAADALWPDAEGDAATHALETAVYRLRRMLGDPAAVLQARGRLLVNASHVFVEGGRDPAAHPRAMTRRGEAGLPRVSHP